MNISNEVKDFITRNVNTESYRDVDYEYNYGKSPEIDFSIQSPRIIEKAERDLAIIKERSKAYMNRDGFRVGERIVLPDGQTVIISNVLGDKVQTSHSGSLHLFSGGGISFSGGLDSGLKKSDLIRIDEISKVEVWIFHEGRSGGGRGVYYDMPVPMYRTKRGADLSGVPQVAALRKKIEQEKSETITRINGNGQEYTLHLPEVIILNPMPSKYPQNAPKEFPRTDCTISGLKFKANGMNNLICQPMKLSQITRLLKENDFKVSFRHNGSNQNTLFLTPTISEREITREFPTVGAFYQPPTKSNNN